MSTFYRCDVCQQVDAEKSVPDSWRIIELSEGGDSSSENMLACTACLTAFYEFLRNRKARALSAERKR